VRGAWLIATCVACFAGSAHAAPSVESYTLKNGLRVHLQEDHTRPRVGIALVYRVGSRDDPPGYSGITHVVEHLLYQGSLHVPEDAFMRELEKAGLTSMNGFVDEDKTTLFEELPSHSWATALWLESDRMAYMLSHVDEATLAIQREVIRNEWRQGGGSNPENNRLTLLLQLLYPEGHPYCPVSDDLESSGPLGNSDHDAIGLDEVAWFFQRYFGPNNATLALVGDFAVADAKTEVERWFGPIQNSGSPPEPWHVAPVRLDEQRLETLEAAMGPQIVLLGWPTPAFGTPEDAALDIIAVLLGADTGPLHANLLEAGLADSFGATQHSNELASVFTASVLMANHKRMDLAVTAIDDELERMRQHLDDRRVQAAKRGMLVGLYRRTEGNADRAIQLARFEEPLEAEIARYGALDTATVKAVIGDYLPKRRRVMLRYMR
jgi:zinc protease